MTSDLEIRVAQLRNRLDEIGRDVADLVRDAYAAGRADGLAAERERLVDDMAQRRPTVV